ncbi:hypothetical protein E3220_09620 [Piscirickettsia salmonis EM-90]|nr:hypothetical protein E3220_09620 [Piscirickettsia salmonis EM-90]
MNKASKYEIWQKIIIIDRPKRIERINACDSNCASINLFFLSSANFGPKLNKQPFAKVKKAMEILVASALAASAELPNWATKILPITSPKVCTKRDKIIG